MRVLRKSKSTSIIDDEKKVNPTTCDSAICCCKCIYRKSLYGTTKFGERIFYAYCCTNLAKNAGVVFVIKNHDKCTNFAAVRDIIERMNQEPEPEIPSVIMCTSGNFACFDFRRSVDDSSVCLATAYPDCPHRKYIRGSGKTEEERRGKDK